MYAKYIKRPLDFILSLCAIVALSPVLLIFAIIGSIAMKGNPFFIQLRPGKDEKIFRLIKFRTMTRETDLFDNPLPDVQRLTGYGRFLRSTSIDELPELFNILKGDMAIIGPRPQLVRDMVFMTAEQRKRHTVRPGLSGLAQVNGRNIVTWEKKFEFDLIYIKNITFFNDVKIFFATFCEVFRFAESQDNVCVTSEDLGDYLLHLDKIEENAYNEKQEKAKELLKL